MKKAIYIILLLIVVKFYGQNDNQTIKSPDKTPPSPEAFALTKYGDLPINESTGSFMYNLPLYTFKAGNLSLPISLNYMGNGVKVDQLSTWTGINWTLNAGGVITRTVYHNPDELVTQRIFKEEFDALNIIDPYDDATILFSYYNSPVSHMWDTQPDIFSFSFLNYSGSFYLDKNFTPHLFKENSDIKIEILGAQDNPKDKLAQNNHFLITTPDGIKYYFGNDEIEISFKEEGSSS